ncbi:hypothetical protein CYMTET_14776 [Cymbomonas tetramitiformis]|uniref:Uncharacterized protein n=1 Tax=Cymbomonas tetramitiformis TaxID=36881 RepID=A0AAE0L9U7_9CHLO|nr:hypothetical protein CYMTET_14776 [Cymbomonas tetramitiformis]
MIEMVKQLIRKGAEKDAEDKEGRTALTWAVRGWHEDVANALMMEERADVNVGTGRRPLHAAAERGMVEMVRELVDKGGCGSGAAGGRGWGERGHGRRPLHAAAERGTVEMVRELMEKDAAVDADDREGCTALTVVLAGGKEAAARALLEAGAGVNAGTGRRPLHVAAGRGMVEMLRELMDKDKEVDAEDGEGRTALTVALAGGKEAAARAQRRRPFFFSAARN